MPQYLIGIMFHEPEPFAQWNRGLIEDYESSTGLYIEADSASEAIAWGEEVGQALLRRVNHDDSLVWKSFGYFCGARRGSPTPPLPPTAVSSPRNSGIQTRILIARCTKYNNAGRPIRGDQ